MTAIDTRGLVDRLQLIESVAILPRAVSTNVIGRRVAAECVENEVPLPSAIIVAREQLGGRGRGTRQWHSPPGKGIYSTLLYSCSTERMSIVPLQIATILARFLRDVHGVEAGIKWPNDILVAGRKIAGVLIEARTHDDKSYLAIGIGINVFTLGPRAVQGSTSIEESSRVKGLDLDSAIIAFIEFIDRELAAPLPVEQILKQWNDLTVHRPGDPISCVVGERKIHGIWSGIDDLGRAVLREGGSVVTISGGEIISTENDE